MYKLFKNLSNELENIPSKTRKVDFTLEYVSKLINKQNIKVLDDGEINELIGIIESTMTLANKQQKEECSLFYQALIAEEAKRLDKAFSKSFFGKLKKKILKFIRNFK